MPLFSRKTAKAEQERQVTVWDNVKSLLFAFAIAIVFRSFLFEPFHIPSGSMRSTLLEGDYVFVSKYAYGYSRYSFPFGARGDYFEGRTSEALPELGDVVVFRLPSDTTIDYIKRVMALPGDTIRVSSGQVYINEQKLDYERIDDFFFRESAARAGSVARYIETLPSGKTHEVLDSNRYGQVDNTEIFTVPEGHFFAMGDNRDGSIDSRYMDEVGFVPIENIVGRADLILLSANLGSGEPFWKFWYWLRPSRFIESID